jgi:hypothetical protein
LAAVADDREHGAHSHLIEFPEALEAFFTRIGELKVVLGGPSAPGVDRLESIIQSALAARERGDVPGAIGGIVQAMELLADLAAGSPGLDAAALRGMAASFKQALAHGALGDAKAAAEVMREESGSRVIPKKPR